MKLEGGLVGEGIVEYRVEEMSEGWMRLRGRAKVMRAAKRGSRRRLAVCGRREGIKTSHRVDGATKGDFGLGDRLCQPAFHKFA